MLKSRRKSKFDQYYIFLVHQVDWKCADGSFENICSINQQWFVGNPSTTAVAAAAAVASATVAVATMTATATTTTTTTTTTTNGHQMGKRHSGPSRRQQQQQQQQPPQRIAPHSSDGLIIQLPIGENRQRSRAR